MDLEQRSGSVEGRGSSPSVPSAEHAGQQGSPRVSAPTPGTRVKARVRTQAISRRDLQIIAFVARFGQVTKRHVREYIFATNSSETPCDRALKRLTEQRLLARVNIPTVGGANGGSGQFVYQVGPAGWSLAKMQTSFWLAKSVRYHSLDIASVFIDINSRIKVIRFETEPDSHEKINYVPIQPDLYVELDLGSRKLRAWIEVDEGTERPRQIKDKLTRYYHAWSGAPEKWNPWPLVIFAVPDEKRRAELESIIKLEPAESRGMYRVTLFGSVVETLTA